MSLWLRLRTSCGTAPLLEASQEKWPIGVLDPEKNLVTIKEEIISMPLKELIRHLRILNTIWEPWSLISSCLSFSALKLWNFLSLLLIFSDCNQGRAALAGWGTRFCQAPQTAALNRNISWRSLGWNTFERQKESKARNSFPGGNLSNESLKSHQEKHSVKDSLELLGDEAILQHILSSTP